MSEAVAEDKTPSTASAFWDQASTLLFAIVIALGIRACVIEPFRIPSGSMLPTLLIGDHLFVNKFIYGVKIPFTETRLPAIRAPESGLVLPYFSRNAIRPGISFSANIISLRPQSANRSNSSGEQSTTL